MAEKFSAEIVTRSEFDRAHQRLEISLCDVTGECRTISLGESAISALRSVLEQTTPDGGPTADLTKIPETFAVGHGRHEPFVMLRFEDEPAYGLTAEQALGLGEALIDEAETMTSRVRYTVRQ
jgi:hypothetical protein